MTITKSLVASLLAFTVSVVTLADDVSLTWTNTYLTTTTTSLSTQWTNPLNWVDVSGANPAEAPTNATDTFRITLTDAVPDGTGQKFIHTGAWSGADSSIYLDTDAADPTLESLVGPHRYLIYHTQSVSYKCQKPRVFSIADPNAFYGWFEVGDANAWFRLPATDSFVPTLRGLKSRRRPSVDVPTAATTARVDAVIGGGAIAKCGAGTLSVGTIADAETVAYAQAGELLFDGMASNRLAGILSRAALHLDASAAASLVHTNIGEYADVDFISRWDDVRRNGLSAQAFAPGEGGSTADDYLPYTRPAFLAETNSPTGLKLMSFGSMRNQNEIYGPSNCVLTLSRPVTNVYEAFFTMQIPGKTSSTLLGGQWHSGTMIDYCTGGTLLCGWSAQPPGMRSGEEYKNGTPVGWNNPTMYAGQFTELTTVSIASDIGGRVYVLGSDRGYASRSGGIRAGEIILFTNALTRAERLLVNRYLDAKWRTGKSTAVDAAAAIVRSGATIGVASNEMKLAELALETNVLVKTGSGTLVVDTLQPSGASIELHGGSVRLAPLLAAPTTNAPASGAYLWLDASRKGDFVRADGALGEAGFVTSWNDCRANGLAATAMDDFSPKTNLPFVVENVTRGLSAVSLGSSLTETNQTYFAFPTWGTSSTAYAGFQVMRMNDLSLNGRNFFGSSDMCLFSRTDTGLLSNSYKDGSSFGAHFSINGMSVIPNDNKTVIRELLYQTNDFVLIAFTSPEPLTFNAISKDRKDQQASNCGGVTVGECLVYHRPLTLREFRDTEAYLMAKWLGKTHPSAETNLVLGSVKAVGSSENVIDTDRDTLVRTLAGEATKLVKRGSGAVSIDCATPESVADGLAVEGGSLSLAIGEQLYEDALYHFDASDATAFKTYTETGTDDIERTFILTWQDVRRNGFYAQSTLQGLPFASGKKHGYDPYAGYGNIMTNPTLQLVTMPDGKAYPTVHFGGRAHCYDTNKTTRIWNAAAMAFQSRLYNVREVYSVFADVTDIGKGYGEIIGNIYGGAPSAATSTICMRGGTSLFNTTYTSSGVQNGYLAIDGATATAEAVLPSGFHVISVGSTGSLSVDGLVQDRDCNAGGAMICEQIAFSRALTSVERTALEHFLAKKWGLDATPFAYSPRTLKVSNGAQLNLGEVNCATASLSGDGTVESPLVTLTDGGVLNFEFRSQTDVDQITVDGNLAFSGKVTIRLTSPASDRKSVTGEWTLLKATGTLTGLDSANVTFDNDLPTRSSAKLIYGERDIRLKLELPGFYYLVK